MQTNGEPGLGGTQMPKHLVSPYAYAGVSDLICSSVGDFSSGSPSLTEVHSDRPGIASAACEDQMAQESASSASTARFSQTSRCLRALAAVADRNSEEEGDDNGWSSVEGKVKGRGTRHESAGAARAAQAREYGKMKAVRIYCCYM